jgi:hypothetical protein
LKSQLRQAVRLQRELQRESYLMSPGVEQRLASQLLTLPLALQQLAQVWLLR